MRGPRAAPTPPSGAAQEVLAYGGNNMKKMLKNIYFRKKDFLAKKRFFFSKTGFFARKLFREKDFFPNFGGPEGRAQRGPTPPPSGSVFRVFHGFSGGPGTSRGDRISGKFRVFWGDFPEKCISFKIFSSKKYFFSRTNCFFRTKKHFWQKKYVFAKRSFLKKTFFSHFL